LDGVITYLNTDLDLTSAQDLTTLARAFESRGVFALHVTRCDNGLWRATFETDDDHSEPESNIAAILAVSESLSKELRLIWDSCTQKEFNVGYDCGSSPWAFNEGLSANLVGRMVAAGVSFRVTLYPDRAQDAAKMQTDN